MRGIKTFEDWEERENRWRDDLRVSAERSVKVSGWKVKRGEFRGDNKRKTSKEEKHSDNEVTGFPNIPASCFPVSRAVEANLGGGQVCSTTAGDALSDSQEP